MVLVTPQLPANSFPLVSQLIQLKMTFSSDHIKHLFKSSATSNVKAAQPHKILVFTAKALCSCFLPPLSQLFGAPHWPVPGNYRHSVSFQANVSVQCLILAILFENPLSFISTIFWCSHTAWHSAKSWCEEVEGERGNLQSSQKPENCEGEASDIYVSVSTHLLSNSFIWGAGAALVTLRLQGFAQYSLTALFSRSSSACLSLLPAERNFRILDGPACWYLYCSHDCWLYVDHS